ncbi:MAG: hypothetical protein AB1546_07910, partial [bacterium]
EKRDREEEEARNKKMKEQEITEKETLGSVMELLAPDSLLTKFYTLLNSAFVRYYDKKVAIAVGRGDYAKFEENVQDKNFQEADQLMEEMINRCRAEELMPGLRIRHGLLHFDWGSIDRAVEEFAAALSTKNGRLEKRVEKIVTAAVEYLRVVQDEIRGSGLDFIRLIKDPAFLKKVDARYLENEQQAGRAVDSLFTGG